MTVSSRLDNLSFWHGRMKPIMTRNLPTVQCYVSLLYYLVYDLCFPLLRIPNPFHLLYTLSEVYAYKYQASRLERQ